MSLPVRAVQRLRARSQGDDGISLLEVVVSLMIIAVVMTSAAGFFLHSLKTTGGAAARQTAVDVTNQELENIRAVPPSSLLTGRTETAVKALLAWPGATDLTKFDDITAAGGVKNFDPQATVEGGAAVPTVTTQTVNNQVFTLHNFIDPCWLPVTNVHNVNANDLACGANPTPTSPPDQTVTDLLRVTVAASWIGGAATDCTQGCTYSASTLVDPHHDPTFQSNISHPTITSIAPNALALNATVTVQVNGAGFKGTAHITVSAVSPSTCTATVVSVGQTITDTTATVTLTGTAVGSCTLTLTNPDGGNASSTFTVDNPPVFTSSSPTVQNYTSGSVTINGSNFAGPSVTPASGQWTGTTYSGTTGISGQYAANAPFPVGGAPSVAVQVTLQNPDGGQATGSITVTQSTPTFGVPANSINVDAGSTYSGNVPMGDLAPSQVTATAARGTVTVTGIGAGFLGLTYQAPATPGSDNVTVTNPDGGSATYTITVKPGPPMITSATGQKGQYYGYFAVYSVSGSNFGSSPTFSLNYNNSGFVPVSATNQNGVWVVIQLYGTLSPLGNPFTIKVTTDGGGDTESGTVS